MTTPSQQRGTTRARQSRQSAESVTDSDAEIVEAEIVPDDFVIVSDIPAGTKTDSPPPSGKSRHPDDIMDRELEASRIKADKPADENKSDTPKAGPPKLEEWQKFFSRVLIRSATNWYIEFAFRGIDEDELSDREVDRIKITEDEREKIARPFAELANKSKFTRKHGRTIVALTDSWDSMVTLGMWYNRVNRVARKHRKKVVNVSARQSESQQPSSERNGHVAGSVTDSWYSPGTG